MLRLKEIAGIDPNSTAFRYSENYDKALRQFVCVDGEIYVSLSHLEESMTALRKALLCVWECGKLDCDPDDENPLHL